MGKLTKLGVHATILGIGIRTITEVNDEVKIDKVKFSSDSSDSFLDSLFKGLASPFAVLYRVQDNFWNKFFGRYVAGFLIKSGSLIAKKQIEKEED